LPKEWQQYFPRTRAGTFRSWPFTEGCACTPEQGRTALCLTVSSLPLSSPSLSPLSPPCFFFFNLFRKEHKKHSAACALLALQKAPTNLTLQEFLKLDRERMKNALRREISQKVTSVEDVAKSVRCEIENL
ncbi:BIRC5 protein, partial [Thinocorus orbignyianus]|nr:BIRC5 protein [Thinocorus orbignyianus]